MTDRRHAVVQRSGEPRRQLVPPHELVSQRDETEHDRHPSHGRTDSSSRVRASSSGAGSDELPASLGRGAAGPVNVTSARTVIIATARIAPAMISATLEGRRGPSRPRRRRLDRQPGRLLHARDGHGLVPVRLGLEVALAVSLWEAARSPARRSWPWSRRFAPPLLRAARPPSLPRSRSAPPDRGASRARSRRRSPGRRREDRHGRLERPRRGSRWRARRGRHLRTVSVRRAPRRGARRRRRGRSPVRPACPSMRSGAR